jgi:hypothetical protein
MKTRRRDHCRAPAQSLVLVGILIPTLVLFCLFVIEVTERRLETMQIEDALQQATRSTVQLLDYATLATGDEQLRTSGACRSVTRQTSGPCRELLEIAHQHLLANLSHVRGLAETPEDLADRVIWTVLPEGGTCTFSGSALRRIDATTPLICAEVRPTLRGIVAWGEFEPFVAAAGTIDPIH